MKIRLNGIDRFRREKQRALRDWLIGRRFFPKVAFGDAGQKILHRATDLLRSAGIPFATGAAADQWSRALHFRYEDKPAVLEALSLLANDATVAVSVGDFNTIDVSSGLRKASRDRIRLFQLRPVERFNRMSKDKTYACSSIALHFWSDVVTYTNEAILEAPSRNGAAARIRAKTFDRLVEEGGTFDTPDSQSLYRVDFPIDVVYTWVDDQDQHWQRQKADYSQTLRGQKTETQRSNQPERWRNRDELRYSLRSLEMFAPFIRKIFLVTNGQRPAWLRDDHPQIEVVAHASIYKNKNHLPTFNSSGIETQLHHIDGLAEHFLYFNDDFFLGQFCTPEDFFYSNGAIKFFPSGQYAYEPDIDAEREAYIIADANAIAMMKEDFGKIGRDIMMHVPYPSRKSLLQRLENTHQSDFDACASNRFRASTDLRPVAFMQYHFGFHDGIAFPNRISHRYLSLWKEQISEQLKNVYRRQAYKTFCINDVGVASQNIAATDRMVHDFLARYYPFPSSFEKSEPDQA